MKTCYQNLKRLFVFALCLSCSGQVSAALDKANCTFNGLPLYGKVKVVENFPDIKVQVVRHFADLKVKKVSHFADSCGEWQFVDNFPDFKIKFVQSFPDIKIKFVHNFPGVN